MLPFPTLSDLPSPRIEPTSPVLACGFFFITSATWNAPCKVIEATKVQATYGLYDAC